jgi:hypothetical protein
MLGFADEIDFVDMQERADCRAYVHRTSYRLDPRVAIEREKQRNGGKTTSHLREIAREETTYLLAGHAATARLDDDPDWFETAIGGAAYFGDLERAYDIAFSLYPDYDRAIGFLRRSARWASEAIAHKELERIVRAVTAVLSQTRRTIDGDRLRSVIAGTCMWDELFPYRKMGVTWRRRFDRRVELIIRDS